MHPKQSTTQISEIPTDRDQYRESNLLAQSSEEKEGKECNQSVTSSKRRLASVRSLTTLVIGLALTAWLLSRVPLGEVGRALIGVKYPLLFIGILGHLWTPYFRAVRFCRLYGVTGRRFELTGIMGQYGLLNLLMPFRTGDVALLGILKVRKAIRSITEAFPRWIVLRCGDLAAILILVLITALVTPFQDSLNPWVKGAQVAAIVLGAVGLIALVVLRLFPEPETVAPAGMLAGKVWALRRGLTGLHSVKALVTVLGYSVLIWMWHALLLAVEYAAFDLPVTPIQFWAISIAVLAISILPIHAPLAVGTMHAAQVGVLQLFDVPLPLAIATAIGIHAAMIVTVVAQGMMGTVILAKEEW